MRVLALVLAGCLCILGVASRTQAAPVISTIDVVQLCQAGFAVGTDNAQSASRKATCVAYIDAVIATVLQIGSLVTQGERSTLFCLPDPVSYDELVRQFIGFARKNSASDNRAAASIVIAAYAERYPCKE